MPLALVSPMERGQDLEEQAKPASSLASSPASSSSSSSSGESGSSGSSGSEESSSSDSSSYDATESEPRTKDTWDTDISTYPMSPFHKSRCCRCLGWTMAILLVPIIIVGILVAKHVLWFTMPTVAYEKGGSSFRLSAIDGQAVSTDFDLEIGVKVDNPNNYPLKFSDVALQLTDFQDYYVGTAMHEELITIPARKSKIFQLKAEIHTNLLEVNDIGDDCTLNGMTTQIKAKGSLRAQIIPNFISVPIPMSTMTTRIACKLIKPAEATPVETAPAAPAAPAAPDAPAAPAAPEGAPAPQLDVAPPADAAGAGAGGGDAGAPAGPPGGDVAPAPPAPEQAREVEVPAAPQGQ